MAHRQRDASDERCTPEGAYSAIEARLSEFGLSMHDFADYPDEESWSKGYDLITEAIKADANISKLPAGRFWVVEDIYGERAHSVHVDSYGHLSVGFLTTLQTILRENLQEWKVVVFSDAPNEDFRITVTSDGARIEAIGILGAESDLN